jgi:SAM-dependent methyltransferase
VKATHDQTSAYYEIITEIVKGCAFESFLEVGIGSGVLACKLTERCPLLKQITGVDILDGYPPPDGVEWIREVASDDFFRTDERTWDAIFVDGDHMRPQATRDTINALKVLNDDGLIFLHDTYPPNSLAQTTGHMVCGDVYKTYLALAERTDLEVVTLPLWCGLTIVRRVHERRLWTMEDE